MNLLSRNDKDGMREWYGEPEIPPSESKGWVKGERQSYQLLKRGINYQGVRSFVEIGVWTGSLVEYLLSRSDCLEEYVAVDPFVPYVKGAGTLSKVKAERWEELYRSVKAMESDPRLQVLRMTSIEAASKFPDSHFDMVYIDGCHDYEAVKGDIRAWLPKIRKNGFISGHDFCKKYSDHVVKAVCEEFHGEHCGPMYMIWLHQVT